MRSSASKAIVFRAANVFALPFLEERDLFALMEKDAQALLGLSDILDFPSLRVQAKAKDLSRIYRELSALTGMDLRPLADRERTLRLRLTRVVEYQAELCRTAQSLGKAVLLLNDTPLMEEDLRSLASSLPIDAITSEIPEGALCPDVPGPVETMLKSGYVERLYGRKQIFSNQALSFLGLRTMLAVQALRGDPEKQPGLGALGPYVFSHAMWLARAVREEGFEQAAFLARDGYLMKEAFEEIAKALGLPVKTSYVRISRRAALPLQLPSRADVVRLPTLLPMEAHTPRSLLALLQSVMPPDAEEIVRQAGLRLNERFTPETSRTFLRVLRDQLYDEERFGTYRVNAEAYFKPLVSGKCATMDVGYNLRSETVLHQLTGADITAFVTHIDSDVALRRGLPLRSLYSSTPWVSWIAREQFLLEDAPSCIAYGPDGPVFGDEEPVSPAVRQMQEEALGFCADMTVLFGELLDRLHFRPCDGCAPFEIFLHDGRARDGCEVENFFHGSHDKVRAQWRLMQTDWRSARLREPHWLIKCRRVMILLREDRKAIIRKLLRR